jgi:DivIVA domain-containing protein
VFWFMLVALVAVVAAVALAVLGDGGVLRDAPPDRLVDPLPLDRPLSRADVDEVRLPVAVRGYRMREVDDVLDRLSAEIAQRDARIAELTAALGSVPGGAHRASVPQAAHVPQAQQEAPVPLVKDPGRPGTVPDGGGGGAEGRA